MPGKRLMIPLSGAALIAGLAAYAGGWATVTVEELPDYFVAGQPATLEFSVRQHGVRLLGGLQPWLEARRRGAARDERVEAHPARKEGRYTASFTPSRPGEWSITINSGFGPSRTTLLPIRAIAPGARPDEVSASERGRRLFVAKGCATCHTHPDVDRSGNGAGPALTGRNLSESSVSAVLSNPPAGRSGGLTMPNLGLSTREISALVSFLTPTADRQTLR